MNLLPKRDDGCPYLQLAPMEGVGDRTFRKAMAFIGGFNEAVRDFIRVPRQACVASVIRDYEADEIAPVPIAAQLMGSEPELMAQVAREIERKGAPRIDLNCGCPSNTVTGHGAGSSLLKEPRFLHEVACAIVQAVSIPVTIKMRSGFEDTSLFRENLLAAQESGVRYITLHPRTKVDGYGPPARWDLIAEAKALLRIPVVGNGDILTVAHALEMLRVTKCDGLMIGRGAVINPFIFHEIGAHFSGVPYQRRWDDLLRYLDVYIAAIPEAMPARTRIGKLKQLLGFIFKGNSRLLAMRNDILTSPCTTASEFLAFAIPKLQEGCTPH